MAITVGYEDPGALGVAGYQIGLGELAKYQDQQALREQAMQLQQQQFAEQQAQNDFRNRFAVEELNRDQYNRNRALNLGFLTDQQQLGLRQQALQQDAASRAAYNQTQLAEQFMRGQQQENAQQQLMAREQAQIMAQADRDRRLQLAKQAAADWDAIQKARADGRTFLSPDHYQQAVAQWQDRYGGLSEAMPVDLPYVEQPEQNPIANFIRSIDPDIEIPMDPNTGELLMEPRDIYSLMQVKAQREQAQAKAKADAEKIQIEAAKAQQEMEREQLEIGFERGQAQTEAMQKQEKERVAAEQKQMKATADEYGKLLIADINEYEKMDPKERTGTERPMVKDGAFLTVAMAEYLKARGYLLPGAKIYIDGQYVRVK